MHNVKTKQTIRIVEWIIHQSHNLSEYTSIEEEVIYLNNEFGLKTILLLNISKNSSSFIFPSG